MPYSAFRRLAEPRIWPLIGLTLWLASCTSTAVDFELPLGDFEPPLGHPAHPNAQTAAINDTPSILDALTTDVVAQPAAAGSEVVDHSQHQMKSEPGEHQHAAEPDDGTDHSQHQMKVEPGEHQHAAEPDDGTDHSQHQMKEDHGEHQHSDEQDDGEDHSHSDPGDNDGS